MEELHEENGVTMGMFLVTLFLSLFVLLLTIPNIYLDNHIYYESRQISHLKSLKHTFLEEQEIIKSKLEAIHAREHLEK